MHDKPQDFSNKASVKRAVLLLGLKPSDINHSCKNHRSLLSVSMGNTPGYKKGGKVTTISIKIAPKNTLRKGGVASKSKSSSPLFKNLLSKMPKAKSIFSHKKQSHIKKMSSGGSCVPAKISSNQPMVKFNFLRDI